MKPRPAQRTAWTLVGIYIVLAATGVFFQVLTNTTPGNTTLPIILFIITVVVMTIWPVIGAQIITHHPRHPVGWLLFAAFPFMALDMFTIGYVSYVSSIAQHSLPVPSAIFVWLNWSGLPFFVVTITLMNLLFPTGKLLSPPWRTVAWTSIVSLLVYLVFQTIEPGPLSLFPDLDNPFAIAKPVWAKVAPIYFSMIALMTLCCLASLISLFLRLRRARGDERQQIKWLIFPAVVFWLGTPISFLIEYDPSGIALDMGVGLHLISVPAIVIAVAFAIFRYRLYDIDAIINRTLVYGTLTVCVVGLYVVVVGALGIFFQTQGNLFIALLATGLVAVLFQPLRERLQRAVNRFIYGERDDPVEVLSRLGRNLETALPPDQVLLALVETIAQTLKLPYVGIALTGQPVAAFGHPNGSSLTFPLAFQGERTGELLAAPRGPDETFTPSELRLLRNLARQAGAAVRNAQLTADLQRSRQNLVTAREEERHRLRRDLHDGIGPTMAGLTLKLDAAKDLIASSLETGETASLEEAMHLLAGLKSQTQEAVQDVRRIVHDLRPPSLDVLGLAPSLQAHFGQIASSGGPHIQMITSPMEFPRLSAAVEVAAYRIVMEAVTNVLHHAHAKRCDVSLVLETGRLRVEIADDGLGIPHKLLPGVGLTSMRERAEELGGNFDLISSRSGTRVHVEIPLPRERS